MRIGLFGGTFDPPHEAHRAACLIAMRRLGLDRVWWLVTPGNPLKDTRGLARSPSAWRPPARWRTIRASRSRGFEAEIGARYTYDTVRYLVKRCPGVRFVWIMGADNLRSFHRWQKWRAHRRPWCRWRWSTGLGRASTPRRASPAQALRAIRGSPSRRQPRCPAQAAGLGIPARAEIAPVLDRAAGAAPRQVHDRRHSIAAQKTDAKTRLSLGTAPVETVNWPCLS